MKEIYKVECESCEQPLKYRVTKDGLGDYTITVELCHGCLSNKFINKMGDVDDK